MLTFIYFNELSHSKYPCGYHVSQKKGIASTLEAGFWYSSITAPFIFPKVNISLTLLNSSFACFWNVYKRNFAHFSCPTSSLRIMFLWLIHVISYSSVSVISLAVYFEIQRIILWIYHLSILVQMDTWVFSSFHLLQIKLNILVHISCALSCTCLLST